MVRVCENIGAENVIFSRLRIQLVNYPHRGELLLCDYPSLNPTSANCNRTTPDSADSIDRPWLLCYSFGRRGDGRAARGHWHHNTTGCRCLQRRGATSPDLYLYLHLHCVNLLHSSSPIQPVMQIIAPTCLAAFPFILVVFSFLGRFTKTPARLNVNIPGLLVVKNQPTF